MVMCAKFDYLLFKMNLYPPFEKKIGGGLDGTGRDATGWVGTGWDGLGRVGSRRDGLSDVSEALL